MTDPRHDLGRRAEDAVATWLVAAGWTVLARRARTPAAELDIVCLDPSGVLVAVEVRARRSERAGSALESLDRRAVRRRAVGLRAWAAASGVAHRGLRVDLVTAAPAGGARWRLRRLADVGG